MQEFVRPDPNGKTSESVELGRAGWMDGQIVLGVNL